MNKWRISQGWLVASLIFVPMGLLCLSSIKYFFATWWILFLSKQVKVQGYSSANFNWIPRGDHSVHGVSYIWLLKDTSEMDLPAFFHSFLSSIAIAKHCDFSSWTAHKVRLKSVIYTPKWDDRRPWLVTWKATLPLSHNLGSRVSSRWW